MELTAPGAARLRRFSFLQKLVLAALLVALADSLFFFQRWGSTLGLYAAALLVSVLLTRPAIGRSKPALAAAAAALLFAATLADDPSLLAAALFWVALSLAALLPRNRFDDGWRWTKRLLLHVLTSPAGPARDWARLRASRGRRGPLGVSRALPHLVLPLLGTILFLALFSAANPLIGDAFGRVDVFLLFGGLSLWRLLFWLLVTVLVWSALRPARVRLMPAVPGADHSTLPGVTPASVALSLLAFNLVFALQNGLDLAFLWSGAPFPEGVTMAEYAHRGAYPLIATALLAGLFVLVTLRPGSATAASPLIRRLVYLWIAQNVLLVASTMLRTADYIEAYSLTRLRIAALIWMGLVALGLLLICYRFWRGKSGAWLINANLACAGLVLAACAFIDLGAAAASWNVRHSRDAGGHGASLDLCYLTQLGPSALLPLIELESRLRDPAVRDRVAWARNLAMDRLEPAQADWHGWTLRGHRHLTAAHRLVAERRLPRHAAGRRSCDGYALTAAPGR
ncbi:MAG TPA: DUF4173 domain-containing protein [Allosphingosinicella sp.]|jgi:hypothetical protein